MTTSPDTKDVSRRADPARRALREQLGIRPDEIVIAAPGQVHRLSGHRFAVWAASILNIAEMPVRLIIQNTGRGARDVAEFARMTGFGKQLILAGADFSDRDLLAVADIAVFLDRDAPLPTNMSADLPIVAAEGSHAAGRNVSLVRPDRPREIAQALLKIIEDKPPATVNDK